MTESRKIIGGTFSRDFALTCIRADDKSRTAELAFSSETAVARWYGLEVLDHSPGAVRLSRLNSGAALLCDHNIRDQVGVVDRGSARIDRDRRGRARVKFSRSQRGEEIFQDVRDEIRTLISVGYIIHAYEVELGDGNAPDTYRITDWEPVEISIVAVPADPTVGVGRTGAAIMPDIIPDEPEHLPRSERRAQRQAEAEAARAERARLNTRMREIGKKYNRADLAEEFIELEQTPADLQRAIAMARTNHHIDVPVTPRFDYPGSEPQFEHIDATRPRSTSIPWEAWGRTPREADERQHRAGNFLLAKAGNPRAARWIQDYGTRTMVEGIASKGGTLVPDELSSAIIYLRNEFGLARRLCDVLPMNSDTLIVPRRTGGPTVSFYGEGDTLTASDAAFDNVELTAKKAGALSLISSELVEDANIEVANLVVRDISISLAETEDDCWLNGDGTSTYGGMVGARAKIIGGNHGAGAVDAASAHDTIPEIDGDDLDTVIGVLPPYASMGARWIVSPQFNARVFQSIARAAGGATMVEVGGTIVKGYSGYPIELSTKMPNNVSTDYSNVAMALFGDPSMACVFGERRGMRVEILTERYADTDRIGVKITERFHFVWHGLGDNTDAGPMVALIGE